MGESKKKGIAITLITGVLAYHPKTWIEISAVLIVAAVAVYAIRWQGKIDEKGELK